MIPALLLAADLRTLHLSATTEARLRVTNGLPPGYDWTVGAGAGVEVRGRAWQLDATYTPFVQFADLEQPPHSPFYYQTAIATVAWHNRFVRLALAETGSLGTRNTTDFVVQQGLPGMAQTYSNLAAPKTITYAQSLTTLSVEYNPTRRWRFGAQASYSLYGGLGADARRYIAFQYGPLASAVVSYRITHQDGVFVRADGAQTTSLRGPCLVPTNPPQLSCEPDNIIANGIVGWQHTFSTTSEAAIGAGIGVSRARLQPTLPHDTTYYPEATATYEYHVARTHDRRTVRLDASVGPIVDLRSGTVDDRVQATGTMTWSSDPITLSEVFGAARSLGSAQERPSSLLFATSRVDYRLGKNAMLTGAVGYLWQDQEGVGGGVVASSVLASVGATVFTSPTRF
jgi:hypothetical protein